MLLENVGHHTLHGAVHLADRKTLVASAPASRLSLSSCPGSPKPMCLLMLCMGLKQSKWEQSVHSGLCGVTGVSGQHQSDKLRISGISLGGVRLDVCLGGAHDNSLFC